jgi:AraC family transcriptional regulator, melibiose operon regulatory protein
MAQSEQAFPKATRGSRPAAVKAELAGAVSARSVRSFDPGRKDFEPYGLTCVRWTPSPMRRPDHHNEIELNLLESGWVTYLLGGQKVRVEAGRLAVFWAAIPHQIVEYGEGTRYFVATIPFAWFLQCRLPEGMVRRLLKGEMVGGRVAENDDGPDDRGLFGRWEKDLSGKEGDERARIVMLEMEARLRRIALGLGAGAVEDAKREASQAGSKNAKGGALKKRGRNIGALQGGELNKVEQMACLIAQRYTEPLTVEEIGRAVQLHPNYAMALFKKAFGTTLIDYVTHHRVSHAQRLLATTDEKIVEVAFSSGFNSLSRFNEAFRRACGCTPRSYRAQHAFEE